MKQIIPILPCVNIKEQAIFYEALGFEIVEIYTSPNAYGVFKYEDLELHFWGSKRNVPNENSSMCILKVDNVDEICEKFTLGLKTTYNKIPRSGIPKITKVRELKDDRRFTLTDLGGNTLYILSLNNESIDLRTLDDKNHANDFAILYDLIYSKEDVKVATNMLNRIIHIKNQLNDEDLARFLLVELDIKGLQNETITILDQLIIKHNLDEPFWKKIKTLYDKQCLILNESKTYSNK